MDNNNNTNIQQIPTDCLVARDIILTTYAQCARLVMLTFNTIPVILFVFLVIDYKRYRLALHGNLKVCF